MYEAVPGGAAASSASSQGRDEDRATSSPARQYLRVGAAVSALVCGAALVAAAGRDAATTTLAAVKNTQKMQQKQFMKVFTWNGYTDALGAAGTDYPWLGSRATRRSSSRTRSTTSAPAP